MHIPILTDSLFTILLTRSLLPLPHYLFTLHNSESLHSSDQIPFHTISQNGFLLGLFNFKFQHQTWPQKSPALSYFCSKTIYGLFCYKHGSLGCWYLIQLRQNDYSG
ncbi:hypothetical protein P8452_42868 [Trifolium repens]|nr:hypothetical protein P8452_42868 [Trifolium repens]